LLADGGARRAGASWSGAVLLHVALLLTALAFAPRALPPTPKPPEALSVQIVTATPTPAEPPGAEAAEEASAEAETAAPEEAPPQRFEVVLPNRTWPDVLRLTEEARRGASAAQAIAPGLPANVRAALATAYYCRSTALGIGAELRRCPPPLDQFALAARVAAFGPNHFFDPATIEAAAAAGLVLGAVEVEAGRPIVGGAVATGPTSGRDRRLSAADEMRDRLPPRYADPAFGD
jgi:hypothetical protein